MENIREVRGWGMSGFLAMFLLLALVLLEVVIVRDMVLSEDLSLLWVVVVVFLLVLFAPGGFFVVQPNEARVLVFFGRYVGTVRRSGFWWTNPFTVKKHVSLRIHNFNSDRLKVTTTAPEIVPNVLRILMTSISFSIEIDTALRRAPRCVCYHQFTVRT